MAGHRRQAASGTVQTALRHHICGYLRDRRLSLHLEPEDVVQRTKFLLTEREVVGSEESPSPPEPKVLYWLSRVYGLPYMDLMARAGQLRPHEGSSSQREPLKEVASVSR